VLEALRAVAPKIVASAQAYVPVVTGTLQRSIEADVTDTTLTIGSGVPYAGKVESNTPYLRPALMDNLGNIAEALKE
jgi:hypothetical protein